MFLENYCILILTHQFYVADFLGNKVHKCFLLGLFIIYREYRVGDKLPYYSKLKKNLINAVFEKLHYR